ncbi:MAG: imidazole glycerol phosphate synthase subunit HisH [Candidatus Omnitrophica bacterium]|nr:imidazole glycerol phosphate synthase subunit HisH [Candidatus Omnitrophota bacterium]
MRKPSVAIVDYGMGNLFSVKNACEQVGMEACVTSDAREIRQADAVILPGVGAFGKAMETLRQLGLVDLLKEVADSGQGKPFVGICLGMQLLMTKSFEFGEHEGLGLVEGVVQSLQVSVQGGLKLKVPQIGWNAISLPTRGHWEDSPLDGLTGGEQMYFVHSFYVTPMGKDTGVDLSKTSYGPLQFCSSLRKGNIVAFQFHPERSGPDGLRIYRNLAQWIQSDTMFNEQRVLNA